MPKATKSAGSQRTANPIFNKDLGQHILKNPLVVNGIVEKVSLADSFDFVFRLTSNPLMLFLKSVLVPVT